MRSLYSHIEPIYYSDLFFAYVNKHHLFLYNVFVYTPVSLFT
jgi:hypothetical protein